jgi:hypothetical protein
MTRDSKGRQKSKCKEVIVKEKMTAAPRAPRRKGQSSKGGGRRKDARWNFSLHDMNVLGVGTLGGISMGSGDGKRSRTRDDELQNLGADTIISVDDSGGSLNKDSQVFEMDELVATIDGDTAFTVLSFPLNAGLAGTTPWLSALASQYERYEFLVFDAYYKSTVSGYATSGQIGRVTFAVDYDSLSAPPTTQKEVSSIDPHVDFMPMNNAILRLARKRMAAPEGKFVRTGLLPAGSGASAYDSGVLYVSVGGTTDTNQIGELHVRYKVRLFNPRLPESVPRMPNFFVSQAELSGATTLSASTAAPFVSFADNGLGLADPVAGVFTLPPGNFLIEFFSRYTASGGNITQATLSINVDGDTLTTGGAQDILVCATGAGITKSVCRASLYLQVDGSAEVKAMYLNTQTAGTQTGDFTARISLI